MKASLRPADVPGALLEKAPHSLPPFLPAGRGHAGASSRPSGLACHKANENIVLIDKPQRKRSIFRYEGSASPSKDIPPEVLANRHFRHQRSTGRRGGGCFNAVNNMAAQAKNSMAAH